MTERPSSITPNQPMIRRGFVLSGDSIVIQGTTSNGPPPEITVYLSNVVAPRLGRRPNEGSLGAPDEPFAFDAREFLRKKLIGETVTFIRDYSTLSGRDYGRVYLGGTNPENAENIAETGVHAGWLEVKPGRTDEYTVKLLTLQDDAKVAKKGRWSSAPPTVREVVWVIDNPREVVDRYKQKPIDAVVEMVRDGSTLRLLLLPGYEYITLLLSGVRAPATGRDKNEPYAEEAKHFVEQRLLHHDVQVILESTSNQNFVGSVIHPKGNIAEALLREGYAKCVDWSIGLCTGGTEKLRAAEKAAKDRRLRLWKEYKGTSSILERTSFNAKVVEVAMSDSLVVEKDDGSEQKIFLSSIRLPRDSEKSIVTKHFSPLYNIPFALQAREFLRKRLIGKVVNVCVDYIQPRSDRFPDKICCTVKYGGDNIAVALLSEGLSKVIRHRADDDNRSSDYDALVTAEANAEKMKKGLFGGKPSDQKNGFEVQEIGGDVGRSKEFLAVLQKGKDRFKGVVEYVSSGNRLRLYIPKENAIIPFVLGGINCPRNARTSPGTSAVIDEPFCMEACIFTRKLVQQRDVEVEIEGIDKFGNFIGYIFILGEDGHLNQNLSILLLEEGFAFLNSAENSVYRNLLLDAEERAKKEKKNIWSTRLDLHNDCENIVVGVVVKVLSGDAFVIQMRTSDNPSTTKTFYLSSIHAPRLAKRTSEMASGTADEPFAWEAREFLRKKLIGQMVTFIKDYSLSTGRVYGKVFIGGNDSDKSENVVESAVEAGWVDVKPGKITDDYITRLLELQESAKMKKIGKWIGKPYRHSEIISAFEDPREVVDRYKQKPIDAVVEMVRDGSTLRLLLLPGYEYITLLLSGVRAPATGRDKNEPYAEEAKHFVEQRLLHHDVQVILESTSNQNFVGSVIHPKGNIAEALLREGYAKCVDWSIGLCTGGTEKLRAAEKAAKDRRLRLWKEYKGTSSILERTSFNAKVVEVAMSDSLVVEKDDGSEQKIFLSSIRLPRETEEKPAVGRQFRPLYDIPFMFQAREFIRKRLIGKNVHVIVDYIQPKSDQFPEKTFCTVKLGDINIAEALLSKGLSKTVRYRDTDENRSSEYDTLMAAEASAEKAKKGIFAEVSPDKKNTLRIQELGGDLARSKQFLPYLQKGNTRLEGVVEFVSSGSRLRIYIPKETAIISFIVGGINCPRNARTAPGVTNASEEPFGSEAAAFTKKLVLQRDVEIEIEGVDKLGNFIGHLFVSREGGGLSHNLAELLLEQGLAELHVSAEKFVHFKSMSAAEKRAKDARRNLWTMYKEDIPIEDSVEVQHETPDRKVNYKKVVVTEIVKGSLRFYAQVLDDGANLEKMTVDLRENLRNNPPLTGSYSPKRGDLCVAPFSADGQWYRARVEAIRGGKAERESVDCSKCAVLPSGFSNLPPAAKEYSLALTGIPNDKHYGEQCETAFANLILSAPTVEINHEYKSGSVDHVQVVLDNDGEKIDIGRTLIAEGFALVERRKEIHLQNMLHEYTEFEQKARREHQNIWEFGDFTGNDV